VIARRDILIGVAATALAGPATAAASGAPAMYGLIGKMTALAGQRDTLARILLEGSQDMPGCLSYVVALDAAEADALWITEVWDREESHKASLSLPSVQQAIARGRPLIAAMGPFMTTAPIGGMGLPR